LTLVLGACGGGGDDDAGITTTSPPTTLPTTTTTSATTSQATTTTTTPATSTTSDVPVVTIPPDVVLGAGDIQVTLIWDTDSDMDLRVVEPSGYEISHHQPESASGGRLDLDDIPGSGDLGAHVESIFWPADTTPAGRYSAYVQHYGSNGTDPGPYTLEVRVGGELIHQETGRVPLYENSIAFEFVVE
jgi:hypothetical protein